MTPSKLFHGRPATFGAKTDIKVPDSFQKLCHSHTFITLPEPLFSLKFEDKLQILCLHAVVQKSIVADFLETQWKYMHQVTADEFFVFQSNPAFRVRRFSAACREGHFCFCDRNDSAVGYGYLVGITSKIFDGITKTIKCFFDIWTPVFFVKSVFKRFPRFGIQKIFTG